MNIVILVGSESWHCSVFGSWCRNHVTLLISEKSGKSKRQTEKFCKRCQMKRGD